MFSCDGARDGLNNNIRALKQWFGKRVMWALEVDAQHDGFSAPAHADAR